MDQEKQRLEDALRASGLPDRQQLILSLAPGCLFGLPPNNLDAIMERVDCEVCRGMMDIAQRISDTLDRLRVDIDEYCRPVRERNQRHQARYERCRRIPIIGAFARKPVIESDPSCTEQPWYVAAKEEVSGMERELASFAAQDARHWRDEAKKTISRDILGRFCNKHRWYMFSCDLASPSQSAQAPN